MRESLFSNMRKLLSDPSSDGDQLAFGPELGQYGADNLPHVLNMCKSIGAKVAQPSANHIDLVRAATDMGYCDWVKAIFAHYSIPMTTISIHCETYAAFAISDNSRAEMFCAGGAEGDPLEVQKRLLNRLQLMFIGAANLGIPALHLFWGMPDNLPCYGWQPTTPVQVLAMRQKFAELVKPLLATAKALGIYLCHEIHFGTIAMTADDLIAVWELLGKPKEFAVGFDPSHFWHGENWIVALDKLRKAGMKIILAHAKNFIIHPGRPLLGHQMDDRERGMHFTNLEEPRGEVAFDPYIGSVLMGGMADFWIMEHNVPAPIYAEAENPHQDIRVCTRSGVKFLTGRFQDWRMPKGHFTDGMAKK